jgi:indole-3-glycerol phosphate synthase
VIAEIKRRSPEQGARSGRTSTRSRCAKAYDEGGAAALSVLTDERFFGGHLSFLESVRATLPLPLLRKDFVIDPYQVDEARVAGADAVLLIVAALPQPTLVSRRRARRLGARRPRRGPRRGGARGRARCGCRPVGINNRDLRTFETDLAVTERLAPRVPERVMVVAESGIFTHADVSGSRARGARLPGRGVPDARERHGGRAALARGVQ